MAREVVDCLGSSIDFCVCGIVAGNLHGNDRDYSNSPVDIAMTTSWTHHKCTMVWIGRGRLYFRWVWIV